jgi:hypothetical protein
MREIKIDGRKEISHRGTEATESRTKESRAMFNRG